MKIALLGAGQMGSGIAQACAAASHEVGVYDAADGAAQAALGRIEKAFDKLAKRGKMKRGEAAAASERLAAHDRLGDWIRKCDFVIEAVIEDREAKRALYAQAAPLMHDDAVLGSNTSSLSITMLARGCGCEDRFIGIHFMNPAPLMPLVEVIPGARTSDMTLKRVRKLVRSLGKQETVSADYPGFIANRILMPLINEAATALYEGIGTVESIDSTARLGLSHPMGPLELADLIGLDTCVAIMRALRDGLGSPKFSPCPLLVRMVEAGDCGRKSGRGFYDYGSTPPKPAI